MKASQYDGKQVLHIDGAGIAHSGVVVGESDDGSQVYVQARQAETPDTHWDFVVSADLIPVMIKTAEANKS